MVPINFVDYGARCDALCRNSNVDCTVCSGWDSAQDEIISNLVLPVSLRTRFPRPDFHGLTLLIRTTHHGRVWSWTFSGIISCPLVHESSRETWLLLDILPTNWCHVSWPYWQEITSIYLTEEHATCLLFICLCRFRCQGPLPINSWFPSLPSSFLKFPSSITLVLDPCLEVSCVHSFPSS